MAVLTAGIVACTKDDDTTPAVPVETAEVTTWQWTTSNRHRPS